MPNYTPNKRIEKPVYNEYATNPTGWSGPINADWDIIDAAFGGVLSLNAVGSVGTANLTISQTQNLIINITGAMTGNAVYTLPLNAAATGIVGGNWIVYNNTSGAFTVTFTPVAGGGTSVSVAQGSRATIYSDGVNLATVTPTVPVIIPAGTAALFAQTAAPTGWTKSTTHNNKALRVVSGTAGSGGTTDFTSVFSSRTITTANMPSHTHVLTDPGHAHQIAFRQGVTAGGSGEELQNSPSSGSYVSASATTGITIANTGGGTAMDFAVQYVDVIIATKD